MKKNVHARVQLMPTSHRLDEHGRRLPAIDDDWLIEEVTADGVRIKNVRTGHTTTLGKDHIYDWRSNPDRSQAGVKCGFLVLKVQIYLKPKGLSITPNARPGETVEPPRVEVVEKWVASDYPTRSGIQKRLETNGYRISWCADAKLTQKTDVEGWEIVIEHDAQGVLTKFRFDEVGPHQTLIKKKDANDRSQVPDFDDFMDERNQKKGDAENLASGTVAEWLRLKEVVRDIVRNGKQVDGHEFQWFADPSAELLVLNYSSATFLGPSLTTPPKFGVYIDRRPPGSGKMYTEDKSPVPSRRWNLEPEVERGEFRWTIRETGWKGSTAELAIGVARVLVAHYDEYKRRFPQAV